MAAIKSPVVMNINMHSYQDIAQSIKRRAERWRCDHLMATVARNGDILCRDIKKEASKADPNPRDIIGTFNRSATLDEICDAILEQMRLMNISPYVDVILE